MSDSRYSIAGKKLSACVCVCVLTRVTQIVTTVHRDLYSCMRIYTFPPIMSRVNKYVNKKIYAYDSKIDQGNCLKNEAV